MELCAPGRAGNGAFGVCPSPEELACQAGTVSAHPRKERARRMPGNESQPAGGVGWAGSASVSSPALHPGLEHTLKPQTCSRNQRVCKTLRGPTQQPSFHQCC